MNIFELYLEKLKIVLFDLSKTGYLTLPKNLDGITVEIPPSKFNFDISTNVAMFLSKVNNKSPIDLAALIAESLKKKDKLIDELEIIKPGFINIKFHRVYWTNFVKEINKNSKTFGVNQKEKKKQFFSRVCFS